MKLRHPSCLRGKEGNMKVRKLQGILSRGLFRSVLLFSFLDSKISVKISCDILRGGYKSEYKPGNRSFGKPFVFLIKRKPVSSSPYSYHPLNHDVT